MLEDGNIVSGKMFKPTNILLYVVIALSAAVPIAYLFVPDSTFTNEEYQEIQHFVYKENENCPQVSTLGQLDKVEFRDDTFIWYLSVYGDRSIIKFYLSHEDVIRKNFKNYFLICSAAYGDVGRFFTRLLNKEVSFKYVISMPDNKRIEETYKASELRRYIDNVGLSPREALAEIINSDIENYREDGVYTPIINALICFFPPSDAMPLASWVQDDDAIICAWRIYDEEFFGFLEAYMYNSDAVEKLEKMTIDIRKNNDEADFLLDVFKLANAKLIFRFGMKDRNRLVDIPIPIISLY